MATGTTTVDFGTGDVDKTVVVASPTITGSSLVEAWIFPADTASNTIDNHLVEDLEVIAYNVVNATGFSIYVKCNTGSAHGIYNLGWAWV